MSDRAFISILLLSLVAIGLIFFGIYANESNMFNPDLRKQQVEIRHEQYMRNLEIRYERWQRLYSECVLYNASLHYPSDHLNCDYRAAEYYK